MVIGTSVGAINGALIAHDPTPRGARALAGIWSRVTREDLYPGNHLTAVWSMLRGKDGLFSNENWRRFLSKNLPCATFGELRGARCYISATELSSGKVHFFGENPHDHLLDALMATCALPPFHPPYRVGGKAYIDGGATANLPLRFAMAQGATQIYALNIYQDLITGNARTVLDVSSHAIGALLQRQIDLELEECATRPNVWLRRIDLMHEGPLEPWDFSRTDELVHLGYQAAQLALQQGLRPPTWQERLAEGSERFFASVGAASTGLSHLLLPKSPVEQALRPHPAPVK